MNLPNIQRGSTCELCQHHRHDNSRNAFHTWHHVQPVWASGSDHITNLVVLCRHHHDEIELIYDRLIREVLPNYEQMKRDLSNLQFFNSFKVKHQEAVATGNYTYFSDEIVEEHGFSVPFNLGELDSIIKYQDYIYRNARALVAVEAMATDWRKLYSRAKRIFLDSLAGLNSRTNSNLMMSA